MRKRYIILGLGISGKAALSYLRQKGESVVAIDRHTTPNDLTPFLYEQGDILVKSPGIPFSHPFVVEAQAQKVDITSEVELGLSELAASNTLFAVTGSNAKTTTTLLIAHVLTKMGHQAIACGNVGMPVVKCIGTKNAFLIVELSSFQLEILQGSFFDAALILNITANHLDRHLNFNAYVAAKLRLAMMLKPDGTLIIHKDVYKDFGKRLLNNKLSLFPSDEMIASNSLYGYIEKGDGENFLAAYYLCKQLGLSWFDFCTHAKSFKKPPHRLEKVATVKGVDYVNDSKATSVSAVSHAIASLDTPVIVIAGGIDKGGDFTKWIESFVPKVKQVVLIGKAAKQIQKALGSVIKTEIVADLKEAVAKAQEVAKSGDTILLSPGCSSFDQFRDYKERGDQFKQLVLENKP